MAKDNELKRNSKEVGMKELLLTTDEASKYLRIKKETLAVWRSTKRYNIPYIRMGRLVRYRVSDLEEFIEKYYRDLEKERDKKKRNNNKYRGELWKD